MDTKNLKQTTLAVHAGARKDDAFGAINGPIYMTSNYRLPEDATFIDWSGSNSNIYARNRNVNQMVLQDRLCALSGADDCVIFGSGVAALASVFTTFLNSGDHVVVAEVCYSATNILLRKVFPKKYNIESTFVDATDVEAVKKAIRPNTRLIHIETPGNPTTGLNDITAIAELAHKNNALLSVDATFAGPTLVHPTKLGADLEIHSMTKYINGHGDSIGGCVMGKKEHIDQLKELALVNYGGVLSPFNAWLVARGLATLPLRMAQHSKTALKVAEFLESTPEVRFVRYPGLKSHPQHELAKKTMGDQFSGMIAFDIEGDYDAHQKFINALQLVTHAVSLGDIESLIIYYDQESDKLPYYPEIFRNGFYRFSVGLEDADDLIADIKQALKVSGVAK